MGVEQAVETGRGGGQGTGEKDVGDLPGDFDVLYQLVAKGLVFEPAFECCGGYVKPGAEVVEGAGVDDGVQGFFLIACEMFGLLVGAHLFLLPDWVIVLTDTD